MFYKFSQLMGRHKYGTYMQEEMTISKHADSLREVVAVFADFLVSCSWEEEQIESAMKAFLDKQTDK